MVFDIFFFGYFIISIGYPIILPRENESVLLGAAILGAVASKKYSTVREAMMALNAAGGVCKPYLMCLMKMLINLPIFHLSNCLGKAS